MVKKFLFFFTLSLLVFTISAFAQISTKTGTIFGKAVDDTGKPLPGVSVTLESSLIPTQTAITQANGGFRFANLPPGNYSVNFSLEGFTEVRQEEVGYPSEAQWNFHYLEAFFSRRVHGCR